MKLFYCAVCGYSMAAFKRTVHLRGKPHHAAVRSVPEQVAQSHQALMRADPSFVAVLRGSYAVTLRDGTSKNITLAARDDLGNYTVVVYQGRTSATVLQLFPSEIKGFALVDGLSEQPLAF